MSNSLRIDYQLVVFDWEGTIADTLGLIIYTVLDQGNKLGFGKIELDEAKQYVDLGLAQALIKLYPKLSLRQHEQLFDSINQALISQSTEICLIPGVLQFIQQLHEAKIDMAIATNKGQYSLVRALEDSGLEKFFKITRSAGQTLPKPNPQMLKEIIAAFGADPSSTLMIGDSSTDMEMARSIHVTGIGIDFYHQQEAILKAAGALAVFDNYPLLANFLGLPTI